MIDQIRIKFCLIDHTMIPDILSSSMLTKCTKRGYYNKYHQLGSIREPVDINLMIKRINQFQKAF